MQDETDGAGAPQGLSWSWELDFATLMECLTEPGPHDAPGSRLGSADPASAGCAPDHAAGQGGGAAMQDAVPGDSIDLGDPDDLGVPGDRVPAGVLAGRVAERLAPGPDLAAWLSLTPAAELGDADLAAIAGGWRRLASWAQSRELAAVAQIASRAAARDEDIGTGEDGRPLRVPASAAAEVALELTMSRHGAAGWADLAVDLGWRLAATGAALESGNIDLYRARLIAEATGMLTDDTARAVEEKVLPAAGSQTPGMLRAALRRAVIIADPRGAEERRRNAERQAKVVLYPDEDHTATLAGQRLPAIGAAAAMAPDWPGLPAIPPAFVRPAAGGARPVSGLLDVSLPWRVLAGASDGPGYLGRIGPVPASQARQLAGCAIRDPAAEWRIIIPTPAGQAIAVTRIPRPPGLGGLRQPGAGPGPGAEAGAGLVGRVTLTISEDILT